MKNNLQKTYGRGLLLSILEKEVILTCIRVNPDGQFTIETNDWDEYWQPVYKFRNKKIGDTLIELHLAWIDYINSKFNPLLRQQFCYWYFVLLNTLISIPNGHTVQDGQLALQRVLGFECFQILSATEKCVLAAGTATLRNPCYLLTKIKMPDALDDPKFLPLITVPNTDEPLFFYHYRQYAMTCDSTFSLLLYPAVSLVKRTSSFKLIGKLVGGLNNGIDPRTQDRACRLFQKIIWPLIEFHHPGELETFGFEIVDIGAGSCSLSAAICRQVQKKGIMLSLRLWFIDLEATDPSRFFRDETQKIITDNLNFIGDDYRHWLCQRRPLPEKKGLRIALISKLLNNLSNFSTCCLSRKQLDSITEDVNVASDAGKHSPDFCLDPQGPGVASLSITKTTFPIQGGKAYYQESLSAFYQGLHLLSGKGYSVELLEHNVFVPVRTFNPESLTTLDGKSVIFCLAQNCDYIVIEDADLGPQDLINHASNYSLSSLVIYDMTKHLKSKSNHVYVLWDKTEQSPLLSGERIW